MAQTKVKTKGITDTNVTNAKLGTDISAAKLTAGTVADARFPATLPAASGVNLTALNATNLGSGTVPTARLGTGTASSSVFLAGDNTWAAAGGGKIGQVLQTVKTDTFSGTSTSYADITGMSVAITPAATSSKILVLYDIKFSMTNGYNAQLGLIRDSTQIYLGDTASARTRASSSCWSSGTNAVFNLSGQYLDSPSTTSATTYKLQYNIETAGTCYVGRSLADGDGESMGRTAQSITVMEVLA